MSTRKELDNAENRWPHRVGCLLVCIVFPLIWIGSLVTTADAGMAVPDWPNTYGYNLFAYPYREWFFGPWDLFVEHGHRLLASVAGFVSILLVVVCFRNRTRKLVLNLAIAILLLVIAQGVFGGIRVIFDARWVAKVHGCVGPLYFAISVAFCIVTSRWWKRSAGLIRPRGYWQRVVPRLATILLVASYLQLCFGAFLRHIDDSASPRQYTLLVACHVLTATILLIGTIAQFLVTRPRAFKGIGLRPSINVLSLLLLVQIGLGISTWVVKFGWPSWFENYDWAATYIVAEKSFFQINVVTAHAAVGSLILAFWTVHALRANRSIKCRAEALGDPPTE